ncbi:MAG TPA: YceI family protein [Solirubrobacterales bacterium]|jgi:polyisoprenoid-binding protein YceI
MAGHNLVIGVTSWEATLDVGEDPGQISLELNADVGSLRVHEGTGGAQPLSDEDRVDIQQTIDDHVLKGHAIEFRSTDVEISDGGRRLSVSGDLNMAGNSHPVDFELSVSSEGQIKGGATLKQTDWGIKPYSALFGALKVMDEVEVVVEASLPYASGGAATGSIGPVSSSTPSSAGAS